MSTSLFTYRRKNKNLLKESVRIASKAKRFQQMMSIEKGFLQRTRKHTMSYYSLLQQQQQENQQQQQSVTNKKCN
jgi:hypothetical protein